MLFNLWCRMLKKNETYLWDTTSPAEQLKKKKILINITASKL
jgi:hypothetical protein